MITAPWDGYVEKNLVTPGDKLRLVNHDRTVFAGQVERVGLDGSATAYDRGWYLNKSTIILQASGIAADEAIRRACAKAGVGVAEVCSLPAKVTQVWTGDTPADIISEILEAVSYTHLDVYKRQAEEMPRTARAFLRTRLRRSRQATKKTLRR